MNNEVENQNEIQLRSPEINEIISSPPKSIVRWGSSIILLIILFLLTGSYFLSFPDKIFAETTIINDKSRKYIALLKFNNSGFGKVCKGQKVIIKIDGFPYMEFGSIKGIIMSSGVINKSERAIIAMALLDYPLITNYGKRIDFSGELTGSAEIITREISLLERMVYPIKYFINSQDTK
jgi:hypothetical protein